MGTLSSIDNIKVINNPNDLIEGNLYRVYELGYNEFLSPVAFYSKINEHYHYISVRNIYIPTTDIICYLERIEFYIKILWKNKVGYVDYYVDFIVVE